MLRAASVTAFLALAFGTGCGGNVVFDNTGGAGSSTKSSSSLDQATSAIATTSTGASMCAGLGEVACLGAYPSCVPLYDNTCCPTCGMTGQCADCVMYAFVKCSAHADACGKMKPACGEVAPGACNGITPKCSNPYCPENPGCVGACLPGAGGCAPECLPVTKGSCTAMCHDVPPDCPPGYVAEAANGCWTGHCIVAATCPS